MEKSSEFSKEQFPEILILGSDEWELFKDIRLRSLQTDPTAFGVSYEQKAGLSEDEWRSSLSDPNRVMYGVKVGDRLAAIAGTKFETGQHVEHMATLIGVFTDPDFRGKGLSHELIKKILGDLHDNPKIIKVRLSVNETQGAARSLYQKLGFREIGIAKKEMKIGGQYYDQAQMELIFEDKL